MHDILRIGEEEVYKDFAEYKRLQVKLVLTNYCVLFLRDNKINFEIPYKEIDEVKYTKKELEKAKKLPTSNTVLKIRVVDIQGNKIDISFKGEESPKVLAEVVKIIRKRKNQAKEENENDKNENQNKNKFNHNNDSLLFNNQDFSNEENQENYNQVDDSIFDRKEIKITENELKIRFLNVTPAAKQMFKDLVVEDNVITEEEFWQNYSKELISFSAQIKATIVEPGFENDSENQNNEIKGEKIDQEIKKPEFIVQKVEPISRINIDEYKPSINFSPALPDVEERNINDDDSDLFEFSQPFNWSQEVIERPEINPQEFQIEADNFALRLNSYSEDFLSIPEIETPVMNDSLKILKEISQGISNFFDYEKAARKNPEVNTALELLRKHKMEEQILLFHFWSNYEVSTDESKIERLRAKICELKNILKTEQENMRNEEALKAVRPLYKELELSIDRVLNL
ncbi:hypothetical protein TRFO_33731 [Tritrichomonas foetus]|uniref:BSD domain-containing protein n=1 Tax=Tritrichomonas foetus TaxID=1144522 RepID=A0A1J4JMV6_9EUKA|nr:hypothetical protein TRFO_33731 [Tritrichomonas foetus]|eukprot:OHS99767.1 hypothetical protein TRFO_33731 [Tritrichomonas foetus]